jgi:hypothetical protein
MKTSAEGIAPPKQSDVLAYKSIYGDPRGRNPSMVSAQWVASNMVRTTIPFIMTYAGMPIKTLSFHKAAVLPFKGLFQLLLDAAKGRQATLDQWGVSITGGSFCYRTMRGLNTLSMHSFGCALDLDPARNGLSDSTPRFAEFPEVMKAFRDSGLTWGGDWNGNGSTADERRCDGMHLQATQRIS